MEFKLLSKNINDYDIVVFNTDGEDFYIYCYGELMYCLDEYEDDIGSKIGNYNHKKLKDFLIHNKSDFEGVTKRLEQFFGEIYPEYFV